MLYVISRLPHFMYCRCQSGVLWKIRTPTTLRPPQLWPLRLRPFDLLLAIWHSGTLAHASTFVIKQIFHHTTALRTTRFWDFSWTITSHGHFFQSGRILVDIFGEFSWTFFVHENSVPWVNCSGHFWGEF